MSTKSSLKYERDDASGEAVHLYEEVFDDENVYLELEGFQFEGATSTNFPEIGRPRLLVRLSNRWAQKLGLIPASSGTVSHE